MDASERATRCASEIRGDPSVGGFLLGTSDSVSRQCVGIPILSCKRMGHVTTLRLSELCVVVGGRGGLGGPEREEHVCTHTPPHTPTHPHTHPPTHTPTHTHPPTHPHTHTPTHTHHPHTHTPTHPPTHTTHTPTHPHTHTPTPTPTPTYTRPHPHTHTPTHPPTHTHTHPPTHTHTPTEAQCTEPRRVHLRSSQPFPGANIFFLSGVGPCRWLCPWSPCLEMAMVASFPEVLASLPGDLVEGLGKAHFLDYGRLYALADLAEEEFVQWARELGASAADVEVWAQGLRRLTQAAELRAKAAQRGFAKRSREELAYFLSERRRDSQATGRSSGGTCSDVPPPLPLVVGAGPEGEARRRPRGVLPRGEQTGTSGSGRRQWPSLWTCWISWTSRLP